MASTTWWGPQWNQWAFGLHWHWQAYMHFIHFDLGPWGLTFEWDLEADRG